MRVLSLCFAAVFGLGLLSPASAEEVSGNHEITLAKPLDGEKSIEDRLDAKASFHAEHAGLKDLPGALEKVLDTPVLLKSKKMEEAAISPDTPLSYRLKGVKVRTGLRLILEDVGLTYFINDAVIVLTTPEDASQHEVTRVYDCRDLLKVPTAVPRKPLVWHPSKGLGGASESETPNKAAPKSVMLDNDYTVDDLIDIITSNVHPDSWDFNGPENLLDFKGLVVVTHTQEVHEDIEKLLNQLHKAAGLEEKIKVSR